MEERLGDALERTDISSRHKMIFMVAPGCLFGFPPPDLQEKIERVDCPHCRPILDKAMKIADLLVAVEPRITALRAPVDERNRARRSSWERLRRIPIIGRFLKVPVDEPYPDHQNEPWFFEAKVALSGLRERLAVISNDDPLHWKASEAESVSMAVLCALLGKNGVMIVCGEP